jgi:hypothetical protein
MQNNWCPKISKNDFSDNHESCKCGRLHQVTHQYYVITTADAEGDETTATGQYHSVEKAQEKIPIIFAKDPDVQSVHVYLVTEKPICGFDRNMSRINFKDDKSQ